MADLNAQYFQFLKEASSQELCAEHGRLQVCRNITVVIAVVFLVVIFRASWTLWLLILPALLVLIAAGSHRYLCLVKGELRKRKPISDQKPDKMEYLHAMVEMASEAERTYRGMIAVYNEHVKLGPSVAPSETSPVNPTPRGIYKARLFGALFMAMAYAKQAPSEDDFKEMVNIATGAAIESLQGGDGLYLDKQEAKSFSLQYLVAVLKSMKAAFAIGSFLPGTARSEHLALAQHLHDALADSIGPEHYTNEVKERLSVIVQGNTAMAMNHALRWMTD